jgi:hypothetical protein
MEVRISRAGYGSVGILISWISFGRIRRRESIPVFISFDMNPPEDYNLALATRDDCTIYTISDHITGCSHDLSF